MKKAMFTDYNHKGGAEFTAEVVTPDVMRVTKTMQGVTETRHIKVKDDPEFTYKILHTRINARGGAEGLVSFLSECRTVSDLFSSLVSAIYNNCFCYVKEYTR